MCIHTLSYTCTHIFAFTLMLSYAFACLAMLMCVFGFLCVYLYNHICFPSYYIYICIYADYVIYFLIYIIYCILHYIQVF